MKVVLCLFMILDDILFNIYFLPFKQMNMENYGSGYRTIIWFPDHWKILGCPGNNTGQSRTWKKSEPFIPLFWEESFYCPCFKLAFYPTNRKERK